MSTPPGDAQNGNGSNSDGGLMSIFQTAGGPPLILVCIAAGLILGAFIGVLLMRRLRPGTVVVHRMRGTPLDELAKLGEKPKLLDVHVLPALEAGGDGLPSVAGERVAYISPFAAAYLDSPSASAGSDSTAPNIDNGNSSSPRSQLSKLLARIRRTRARHDLSTSISVSQGSAPQSPLRDMQLAYAILMPCPRSPRYVLRPPSSSSTPVDDQERTDDSILNPHDHNHNHEDSIPDCVIGTRRVLYRPAASADASEIVS